MLGLIFVLIAVLTAAASLYYSLVGERRSAVWFIISTVLFLVAYVAVG